MSEKIRVKQNHTLLPFLSQNLRTWSRTKVKQRLQSGCVVVNGEPITQHNYALESGDLIEVLTSPKTHAKRDRRLEIIYSDDDLIAIHKPSGLLSVASDSERKESALYILRGQLSTPKKPIKLWPVHRLDRETSGVLLFASSRAIADGVSEHWPEAEKTYWAVVGGHPNPPKGTIDQPLRKDRTTFQVSVSDHHEAKDAITHFRTLRSSRHRSLLELKLETGRQHQIRVHLAWLGHSVVGDKRYGKGSQRMALHALSLCVTHPRTGQRLTIEAPAPETFMALV